MSRFSQRVSFARKAAGRVGHLCVCLALLLLACAARPARAAVDLWPLLELGDDTTTVLYPFFVHENDFVMAFPFYYRTNQGRDHHLAWPLIKVSSDGEKTRLTRLAPVWFSRQEGTFTLFPLIHQDPDMTFWMIPPSVFERDGSFMMVFPLFGRSRDSLWIFPTYYQHRGADLSVTRVWPVFKHSRSPLERETAIPLVYSRADRRGDPGAKERESQMDERSRTYSLLYQHRTVQRNLGQPGQAIDEDGEFESHNALLLFTKNRRMDFQSTQLFPVYSQSRWTGGESLWLLPWYSEDSPSSYQRALYPLFGFSTRTDHRTQDGVQVVQSKSQRLWLLAGLYKRQRDFDAQGELTRRYRRYLLFSDEWTAADPASARDANGQSAGGQSAGARRTFRVLGIPVREDVN